MQQVTATTPMAGCWSSSSIETVNKKRFRAKCSSSLLTLSPAQRLTTQIRWTSILAEIDGTPQQHRAYRAISGCLPA